MEEYQTLKEFKRQVTRESRGGLFGLGGKRKGKQEKRVWVSSRLREEEERRLKASKLRLERQEADVKNSERPIHRVTPYGEPNYSSTPDNAGTGKDLVTVAIEKGIFRGSAQGGAPRGTWRDRDRRDF